MHDVEGEQSVQRRLVEQLYMEAMLLADDARAYFDVGTRAERDALDPTVRVGFSCESLKVTTRLMHVIAWLLTQRAVAAGELMPCEAMLPSRRLGKVPDTDLALLLLLPAHARALVEQSVELYRRSALLDRAQDKSVTKSPVRALQERLALAL